MRRYRFTVSHDSRRVSRRYLTDPSAPHLVSNGLIILPRKLAYIPKGWDSAFEGSFGPIWEPPGELGALSELRLDPQWMEDTRWPGGFPVMRMLDGPRLVCVQARFGGFFLGLGDCRFYMHPGSPPSSTRIYVFRGEEQVGIIAPWEPKHADNLIPWPEQVPP
jgi:hypothetical protein